jgi:hypothetical protein
MKRVPVRLGKHGNSLNAELLTAQNDPKSDFSTVGD